MGTYKDMTWLGNIFSEKYVSTIMHNMLRTSTNISHRKLQKQKVQQFFVGFLCSSKQNNTSKQTRHNYKRSQRQSMKTNSF